MERVEKLVAIQSNLQFVKNKKIEKNYEFEVDLAVESSETCMSDSE